MLKTLVNLGRFPTIYKGRHFVFNPFILESFLLKLSTGTLKLLTKPWKLRTGSGNIQRGVDGNILIKISP